VVRATISYSIPRGEAYWVVRLVVDRAGRRVLDARVPDYSRLIGTGPMKQVFGASRSLVVGDLDGDHEPEILLEFYGGGAHCCFWSRIYRWDAAASRYATIAHLWGNVNSRLADLGGDRQKEFVSADDRFAYVFASYADSTFPLRIWTYRQGTLVDTTRAHPALIAQDAARQWRLYRERLPQGYVRGFLAAWAADQCLLGRGPAALARLARLSSTFSDRRYSDSAAAYLWHLRSFLRRTGYLR
jgi:hypothetical protein